jgi:HPt (histidine-containing phosphotransfer) domain-containing protein
MAEAAHSLKSSSATLGGVALARCCYAMERDARAGATQDVHTQLASIELEHQRILPALQAALATATTGRLLAS